MSEVTLKLTGLDELKEQLKKLPPQLVHEGSVIVTAHAEEMARHVRATYAAHQVTGNLLAHLTVETSVDAWSAKVVVKNTAKHAHFFEKGTTQRHYTGAWKPNKNTGSARPVADFIPAAIQRRRLMLAALIELVERAGLTVTGSAA